MVKSILRELERKENEFSHQKVDITCIKKMKSFSHLGRHYGPFKLGHSYNLDNYIARILVEEGFCKYDENGVLNRKAIQKINFIESTNKELGDLNNKDYIYVQAHEQLEILNTLSEKNKIPRQDFKQLYSDVNDLIRVRMAKISRLANQSSSIAAK
ncbi:MAG: hypothetical protein ACTSUI_07015, partial [Promethearchaeota archaeon]